MARSTDRAAGAGGVGAGTLWTFDRATLRRCSGSGFARTQEYFDSVRSLSLFRNTLG